MDDPGDYNGGGATNADNGALAEAGEANNVASASIALSRPDLSIGALNIAGGTIVASNPNGSWTIPVTFTVTNIGSAPTPPNWYDLGYLSADATLDSSDQSNSYMTVRTATLAPGASYTVNANFTTSTSTTPGSYTFFVKADGHNSYTGGSHSDNGYVAEGNETNNLASVALTLITKTNTSVALTSSLNPMTVGQSTTLTATVTPSAATGMVTFKDGSQTLGTATVSSGVASLTTSFAAAGTHSLTAAYPGDTYHNASTSAAVTQTVNTSATTITLAAAPSAVAINELVTLTATLTGVNLTGNVTFKDGSTTLGTFAISGNTAELITNFSTAGSHSITATYPGDANNQASTSNAVNVVVGSGTIPSGPMLWSYGYDANGNQRYTIDPNGNQTDRGFDTLSRPITITQPAPLGGGSRPAIGLGYDGRDQVSSVTDPRSLVTNYTLNGLGDTTATASPDAGPSSATYDAAGNLATRTDARGKTATYSYDSLNRLTGIAYPTGTASAFEYDGGAIPVQNSIGKLGKITDESGSTSYTHDGFGRVVGKTQVASGKTFAVAYGWGSTGGATDKLTSIRYSSGAQVNYSYDATGRINAIALHPVNSNGAGTNTGVTLNVLSALAYTGANEPKGWSWADGSAYQRAFDSIGRLTSYALGKPGGSGPAAGVTRTLGYDNASRITGYSHAGAPSLDQTFGYDGLDRLGSAVHSSTSYGYGYDATGNRTSRAIGATSYANAVSPSSNRLTSVQGPSGTATYSYDAAGNVTSDGQASYTYSDRGRMSRATIGASSVDYLYNALEQRVSKTGPSSLVPSGAAYYVYDEGGRLLGEYDADQVPIYETVYLGDTPVALIKQTRSGSGGSLNVQTSVSFVYADHLDTPRVLARNSDQAIVWRWDQAEPFGATPPNENPNGLGVFRFSMRFPGQVFDAETGLFYNWHRDYSAGTGRYVQSDPIGLAGGINTYAYVEGNPVSKIDPTGEFGFFGALGGAGINAGGQAYALVKFGGATWEQATRCIDISKVVISAGFGLVGPTFLNGALGTASWSFVAGTQVTGIAVKMTWPFQPYTPFGDSAECDCLRAQAKARMPAAMRQLWDNLGI